MNSWLHRTLGFGGIVLANLIPSAGHCQSSAESAASATNLFSPGFITALLRKANDYQMAHPVMKASDRNWERGTWFTGVMAAGVHLKKLAVDTSPEEFLTVMSTHVIGAHALTQALLPGMIQRKHGSVIFIASMASLFGIPKVVAYSAAKSAYVGMVRTLAAEVSADNVRVNAIAPGWIDSDMMRQALAGDPARRDKILGRTPMGKFGDADDIGWAAVYLCSPAAKFVTGVVLPVNGGVSIGF